MPNIIVESGTMSKEIKIELLRSLTKTAAEITSIPETSFTALIREHPIENWCIGGVSLEEIVKGR